MNGRQRQSNDSEATNEGAVQALYQYLLESWNTRNPTGFAALFIPVGNVIGFDGSMMNGRADIEASLRQIFADHQTAAYVGKVREVRFLAPNVAILRAIAGMVPPGQTDLNPSVNTIRTLVAERQQDSWSIVLYQNTPAQFHGRPDLVEQMTDELRQVLKESGKA